jgi:hypothetical protein
LQFRTFSKLVFFFSIHFLCYPVRADQNCGGYLESNITAESVSIDFLTGHVSYTQMSSYSQVKDQRLRLNQAVILYDPKLGKQRVRWASQRKDEESPKRISLNEIETGSDHRIRVLRSQTIELTKEEDEWVDTFQDIFVSEQKRESLYLKSNSRSAQILETVVPYSYKIPDRAMYDLNKEHGSEIRFTYDDDAERVRIEHWQTGLFYPEGSTESSPTWGSVQIMNIRRQGDEFSVEIFSPMKDQNFTTMATVLATAVDVSKAGIHPPQKNSGDSLQTILTERGESILRFLREPGGDRFYEWVKESEEFRHFWHKLEILAKDRFKEGSQKLTDDFLSSIDRVTTSRIERKWFAFQFKTMITFNPSIKKFLIMETHTHAKIPHLISDDSRTGWHVTRTEFENHGAATPWLKSETRHFSRPNIWGRDVEMSDPSVQVMFFRPNVIPILSGHPKITNELENVLFTTIINNVLDHKLSPFSHKVL